jgi:hypothetical protein
LTSFYSGLHLSCTWPIFSEELVTENDDCNDFDPLLSEQWAIGVTLLDDLPVLLSETVHEYMKLSTQRESVEQLLGNIQKSDGNSSIYSEDVNCEGEELQERSLPPLQVVELS